MSFWAILRQASTPADRILLLLLLLAVPLAFWVSQSRAAGETVQIFQDRHLFAELPLDKTRRIQVPGPLGNTLVEVREGKAHVLESPCQGKQCIRAGWLSHAHDSAACVPNHVLVLVTGTGGKKAFDAIAE